MALCKPGRDALQVRCDQGQNTSSKSKARACITSHSSGQRYALPLSSSVRQTTVKQSTKMSTENEECEDRISDEILVDCYNESERAMGWYYYLEDKLAFPFKASCIRAQRGYPLRVGDEVIVKSMAGEDECTSDMKVIVEFESSEIVAPLGNFRCISRNKNTRIAVGDWSYWQLRGYEF